jgi:hypothetical protein
MMSTACGSSENGAVVLADEFRQLRLCRPLLVMNCGTLHPKSSDRGNEEEHGAQRAQKRDTSQRLAGSVSVVATCRL